MAQLNEHDFQRALEEIIPREDRVVVLFAALWTFGHRFGWPSEVLSGRLLDLVDEVVGNDRTLVIPSYSFSFLRTREYDLVRTKPDSGILAEAALARGGMTRTRKPCNSYLVRGSLAHEVMDLPCTTAWGKTGVMSWLSDVEARICYIGIDSLKELGWALVHCAEEFAQVPYRYFKRFPGRLLEDGEYLGPCEEVIFVPSLNVAMGRDYGPLHDELAKKSSFRLGTDSRVSMRSISAKDVVETSLYLLAENEYVFVTNEDEVRSWVEAGKATEMASLRPEEKFTLPEARSV